MSDISPLPRATRPFVEFATVLRTNGFAVAPEQTQNFIAAVGLLGPQSMDQIHQAAVATLAPPQERRPDFDALFRTMFLGQTVAAAAPAQPDEEELEAYDAQEGTMEVPEIDDTMESGAEATTAERLSTRRFHEADESIAFANLRRKAPEALPKRASRRRISSHRGDQPDMRKALRDAVKRDGEVVSLPVRARNPRQRRIVLLIDISGSMKNETETYMRFAHSLMRSAERCEAFTLGTRLTRITRAIKVRNRDQALATASTLVADWDGGTRLGDALEAFLDVPRFAGFARGALVVILSDGLERGDSTALKDAVEHLSRLSWSILWLTPLAADTGFVPQTEAMQAIKPFVDHIGRGHSSTALCDEVLGFARRAA
ncbi:MAG: vWA domain-containing protein [Hyphomicrobiales bacterium]